MITPVLGQYSPTLSLFISPCELQLSTAQKSLELARDSTANFQKLYDLEKQISSGFKQIYLIEKQKSIRADTLRRKAEDLVKTTAAELDTERDARKKAEAEVNPLKAELSQYKAKTWLGRQFRKVKKGLTDTMAVVGVAAVVITTAAIITK